MLFRRNGISLVLKLRKCNRKISLLPCKKVFKIFTIYKIEETPDKHNYYSNVPDYAKFRPSLILVISCTSL